MKNNKILFEKIIEKAIYNGYKIEEQNKHFFEKYIDFEYPYLVYCEEFVGSWTLHINEIIFNHDFAKAFWGEKKTWNFLFLDWQYHLRQMILEKNPLKYLEKFL